MDYVYFIGAVRKDDSGKVTYDVFKHDRETAEKLKQLHKNIVDAQINFGRKVPINDIMCNGPISRAHGTAIVPYLIDYFRVLQSSSRFPDGFFACASEKYKVGTAIETWQEKAKPYNNKGRIRAG